MRAIEPDMRAFAAGARGILILVVAQAGRSFAAANIPPEVPLYHLGSCGSAGPVCGWSCATGSTCCGDASCELAGCSLDVVEAFSAQLVVRATDCPSGGGAQVEFGLRGTRRDGSPIVVPSRTIDLCTADVQCGRFNNCASCAEPDCPPLCADPQTTCPPFPPAASLLCEHSGGGPNRPGGRPEPCRDPPGSDNVPSPGRRFCSADMIEPLRFERWLKLQPLLQAIRDDLATNYYPDFAGPAVIERIDRRIDDPLEASCGESVDPAEAEPCCRVVDLPDGGREAACCVTVSLLRDPRPLPVPLDVASAVVSPSSLAVTTNPCEPLCGNGAIDPGEQCDVGADAACPGQCLPAGHGQACRCNRPPRCDAASARPARLWPPDGEFVRIAVDCVADPDGDAVVVAVTDISQDEPVVSWKRRRRCVDGIVSGDGTALVRAERKWTGDGRVYRIGFTATDPYGGQCTGAVTTCVPHDHRAWRRACVDQGPRFDSTLCVR